jgi:pimeloyl-[acyl-carrier protein] methyl ester esterase
LSLRARILVFAALALALFSAGSLSPPPTPLAGAFGRGPDIVLVHGLGSGIEHWLPTARRLARSHRVVLVDLPGHGLSEMPEPFSLERAVQGLDAALARNTQGPVLLVGHSLGGLVAAAEACDHPGRVRGLVLVETALRPQVEGAQRTAALAALDRDYQGTLREAYLAFGRDTAQGAALYRQVAAMDSAVIKPWIRLAFTTDLSARVARLACPVLVVLAPRSWPAGEPWRVTAAALGYPTDARVQAVRIEGCGHFVMLDRPEELARLIGRFADGPESRALVLAVTAR